MGSVRASQLLEYPVAKQSVLAASGALADCRFAASVAAFGRLLRGGKHLGESGYADVAHLASGAVADRRGGRSEADEHRREFVSLVKLAQSLAPADATERVGQIGR